MKYSRSIVKLLSFASFLAICTILVTGLASSPLKESSAMGAQISEIPDFKAKTLDGSQFKSLEKLGNNGIIYNFFATWCLPCKAEHKHLMALREKGATIIGINWGEDKETLDSYLKANGNPFESIIIDDGKIAKEFKVQAIPETFVFSPDGKLTGFVKGAITTEDIKQ